MEQRTLFVLMYCTEYKKMYPFKGVYIYHLYNITNYAMFPVVFLLFLTCPSFFLLVQNMFFFFKFILSLLLICFLVCGSSTFCGLRRKLRYSLPLEILIVVDICGFVEEFRSRDLAFNVTIIHSM